MISLLERLFGKGGRTLSNQMQHHLGFKKRFDSAISIFDAGFVSFDTELTGRDFRKDSIISIGAVKLKGGTLYPAKTFYRLVKPETELSHKSVVIHEITPSDLPIEINQQVPSSSGFILSENMAIAERHFLARALTKSQGNKTEAAKLLGISRKNLWEKLKNHQL